MESSKPSKSDVNKYISSFPADVQEILKKVRKTISEVLPQAEQRISYGVPAFKVNGKAIIYFAGFKKHISIYPATGDLEKDVEGVSKYKVSKGTMQFKLSEPIPYDLIKKVAEYRLGTAQGYESQN
jgi:uncharacterized protein YdhG (YjbR/CyaY superfamily)